MPEAPIKHWVETQQLAPQVLRIINEGLSSKGLLPKSGILVDASLIAAESMNLKCTRPR